MVSNAWMVISQPMKLLKPVNGILWLILATAIVTCYLLGILYLLGLCCCCCCGSLFGRSAESGGAQDILEQASSTSSSIRRNPTDVYNEQASSIGSFSNRNRNPQDVVEDLGFGLAQLKVMILAEIPVVIGQIYEVLVTTAATSVASSLRLSAYERGLVVSAMGIGRIPGSMVGGWLGDRFGRRPAIVASNILMAASTLGMAAAPDFMTLFVCHAAFGFSHSIGLLSSNIMIIELTPKQWRVTMLFFNSFIFVASAFSADLICLKLDPTLLALDWRFLFTLPVPALFVLFILTGFLLDESPVFSACTGNHAEAQRGFERMRQLNARPEVSIQYTDATLSFDIAQESGSAGSLIDNLSVLFSQGVVGCTLALILLRLVEVLAYMGRSYGMARVFIVEADSITLSPGMQVLVASAWGFVSLLFPLAIDRLLSRKGMLLLSLTTLAVAYTVFAWSAHIPAETWMTVLLLQSSIAIDRFFLKIFSMISSVVIIECYPTAMRTTNYALIGIFGKVGGIAGPVIFEWFYLQFGMVTAFFYFLSGFAFCGGLAVFWLLPRDLESAQLIAAERMKAILSQSSSIKDPPAEKPPAEEPSADQPPGDDADPFAEGGAEPEEILRQCS
mmetsp:Transcript_102046/g.195914  ORF Transcript_102046/g.195914 Transcript_102046/m.195914 type:complete len:617 (+) Transcript_102046:2-1852(+)